MIHPPGWKYTPLTAPLSTADCELPASQLRPGWLADDHTWRETLVTLPAEDAHWFEEQWQLAGGRSPAVDLSWLTFEPAPRFRRLWVMAVIGLGVAAVVAPLATVWFLS